MSQPTLRGVIAAIATPVDASGVPDAARFLQLARSLLDGGCNGLNVLGTTGEATSFSVAQRMALMEHAARELPLARLMVGTGAAATADAAQLTHHASQLGFAGALLLPPFYYKGVPDEGVLRYLDTAANAAPGLPLYLYNFPALSGVAYTPALVRRILDALGERVVGLKDSSGNMDYAREIASLDRRFAVFPSTEAVLLEARDGAFAGCISATANLNATYCSRAWRDGDATALATAVGIRKLFDGRHLVPGIKALLAHIHGDPALAATAAPLAPTAAAEAREVVQKYRDLIAAGSAVAA